MIYGYIRVSTIGQKQHGNSLADQKQLIESKYPNAKIVTEAYSGAKERPLFNDLINKLQAGDTLVITKLDRFCRSAKEGLEYIDMLRNKGVVIHILNMGLIEDTPMGKLLITNLLAFAEFERSMILERTSAGKEIAKLKPGYKEGRPKKEVNGFNRMYERTIAGEISVKQAIKALAIDKSKWYRLVKENIN